MTGLENRLRDVWDNNLRDVAISNLVGVQVWDLHVTNIKSGDVNSEKK